MTHESFFQLVAEDLLEICGSAKKFSIEFIIPVKLLMLRSSNMSWIRLEYSGYSKEVLVDRDELRELLSGPSLRRFLGEAHELKERWYNRKLIGIPYEIEKRRLLWIYDAETLDFEESRLGFLTISSRWLVLVTWGIGGGTPGVTIIELVGRDQRIAIEIAETLLRILGAIEEI